jgi:hypothetical protein
MSKNRRFRSEQGVTNGIRADPRGFTGMWRARDSGIHVGPKWSYGMSYDDTGRTNVAKREGWLRVDRRGLRSSTGVDCDILV